MARSKLRAARAPRIPFLSCWASREKRETGPKTGRPPAKEEFGQSFAASRSAMLGLLGLTLLCGAQVGLAPHCSHRWSRRT
eukprot:2715096-Prymnesium_polylepis.1